MKRRLYYLADNIETVDQVANLLQRQGVTGWNFHVLSRDEAGLYKHHLHSATPLHSRDVLRFGERGALFGLIAGIVISLVAISMFEYLQSRMLIGGIVITALVTLHGAWIGGMAGLATENHKIKRFHRDIDNGKFLLMIDVDSAAHPEIKRALNSLPVAQAGDDNIAQMPFSFGRG